MTSFAVMAANGLHRRADSELWRVRIAGGDNCGAFESTDNCKAAAWWPEIESCAAPFGEAGGDAVRSR